MSVDGSSRGSMSANQPITDIPAGRLLPREWPVYPLIAAFALLAAVSIWRDRHRIWPTTPTLEETS